MNKNNDGSEKMMHKSLFFFGCFMSLVYFLGGIGVIFLRKVILPETPPALKIGLGALLMVYGLFRFYRLVSLYKTGNGTY